MPIPSSRFPVPSSRFCVRQLGSIAIRRLSKNLPDDPIPKDRSVEVEQQSHPLSAQPEIGLQLCLVDRKYPFDALELNDNLSFGNEIHAVTAVPQSSPDPLVTQRQRNVPLELYLAKPEFMRQVLRPLESSSSAS